MANNEKHPNHVKTDGIDLVCGLNCDDVEDLDESNKICVYDTNEDKTVTHENLSRNNTILKHSALSWGWLGAPRLLVVE